MKYSSLSLFFVILLLGGILRFVDLDHVPPGVYSDEAYFGIDAANALKSGDFHIYYPANNGRGALYITAVAGSFSMFGVSAVSLRAVSASFGTLTLIFVYLLGLELWPEHPARKQIALTAMFLLAVNYWHLNSSRFGVEAVPVPFVETVSVWLLLKAIREKRNLYFILSGMMTAVGLYAYIAYLGIFPLLAIVLIYVWLINAITIDKIAIFAAAFLLVASPLMIFIFHHPDIFLHRAGQVGITQGAAEPVSSVLSNIYKTVLMLFSEGDRNFRHNYNACPELSWVAMLGIASTAWFSWWMETQERNKGIWLVVLWSACAALPEVFSYEGIPHASRSIGMTVPLHMLAAWGLWQLWESANAHTAHHTILKFCAVLLLISNLITTSFTYFILWAHDPRTLEAFSSYGVFLPK